MTDKFISLIRIAYHFFLFWVLELVGGMGGKFPRMNLFTWFVTDRNAHTHR